MHHYVQRETDSYKSHDFFSESHHDYIVKCIFVYYIDVGSLSILGAGGGGGQTQRGQLQYEGGGVLRKVHIHMCAHVCTYMC